MAESNRKKRRRHADANTVFSKSLKNAKKASKISPQKIAEQMGISPQQLRNYENGNTAPEAHTATKLALLLKQNPREWTLQACLQRASQTKPVDHGVLTVLESMLDDLSDGGDHQQSPYQHHEYVSLSHFPQKFHPLAVIVGDKREDHPVNTGDLFAFSASPVDDRWLASLGLAEDTEKYSDKVFSPGVAKDDWLRKRFGKSHLISIGSPASNLFTRMYNKCFLFRFALSRETERKWYDITQNQYPKLDSPAKLRLFADESKDHLRHTMRLFKQPGFVNYLYKHFKMGIDSKGDQDFAVISVGRNPYAEPGAPFYAILVAGIHLPGTAQALKFLAEPDNFTDHPFGGILEVEVPSKDVNPLEVEWYEKIEKSKSFWHDVAGDPLRYDSMDLKKALLNVRQQLETIQDAVDFVINKAEIEQHLQLLESLAPTREEDKQVAPVLKPVLQSHGKPSGDIPPTESAS